MRKIAALHRLAGLAGVALPVLAFSAMSQGQCTGFTVTSSTGASIVPGTTDSTNHADDGMTAITLPFGVNLYGTSYTTAQVCSNGNMQFTTADSDYTNVCLPSLPQGVAMMPHWDDLRTDATGGGVFTSVSGVAPNRVFNIEWRAIYFGTTTTVGFEVRLYENNSHFEYIYGTMPNGGSSATVGVQNGTTVFNQFECNNGGLTSGLKVTFTPINSSTILCASGGAAPATVNNCSGATTLFAVHVTPGTSPPSTGITVTGDLSVVNGSSTQQFYDDGTHGDVTSGDNTFSYLATIPPSVAPGGKTISYTCADAQSRSGGGSMSLTVNCVAAPNPTIGPDVVTWDITDVPRWGTDAAGAITAYSVGTTSSNEGDYPVNWINNTSYTPDYDQTQHPVISQNMYRFKTYGTAPNTYTRFEQLGQSWLKHGFVSTNSPGGGGSNPCSTGAGGALGANLWRYSQQDWDAVGGEVLSVGCTDTYGGSLNGSQGSLGPKSVVNATTGFSQFIQGTSTGDANTHGRLQVPTSDVTSQPTGTRFFVDAWYVTQDDAQFVHPSQMLATNNLNSASWREITASTINTSPAFANSTQRHNPGIFAWSVADPTMTLVTADDDSAVNPGTGYKNPDGSPAFPGTTIRARFWIGAKATSLGGGMYRYEYAVYNHNSDRSGAQFSVPVPAGATVSDIAFHAPQWHSGEPYSNAAWTNSRSGDVLTFATIPYATNQNANALRWGCLYNFGFTTNAAPTTGAATIGMFKPGSPGAPASINANGIPVPNVPPPCGSADFNCDGDTGTDDDIEAFFACIAGNCPAAPCTSNADFDGDGDFGTDADIEAFFRVLAGGTC